MMKSTTKLFVANPLIGPLELKVLMLHVTDPYRFRWCYRRGQACAKVKRAAAAIAEAIAEPEAKAYRYHFCYRRGQACAKNKRALEELSSVVDQIQSEYGQEIED